MESPFPIKDQESKVDKILSIIGEISTSLEKILIFKPYSPRSLKKIEEKLKRQSSDNIETKKNPIASNSNTNLKQS